MSILKRLTSIAVPVVVLGVLVNEVINTPIYTDRELASFRERDLGTIEVGKLADLAVLDRDYLTVPVDQIKDIMSVMTIVGGRVVHDEERGK